MPTAVPPAILVRVFTRAKSLTHAAVWLKRQGYPLSLEDVKACYKAIRLMGVRLPPLRSHLPAYRPGSC